ncbi:MAG: Peptidase T [Haliscomenobacter sp.]|jgi:tripeptide aminopeptidase|nr:Peptidase T [Haliscomenobacter sp.]
MELAMKHTVLERFLRYVQIDTQSDPESPTQPSTEKQKDLSRVLVEELLAMGIADAHLDPHGYVYATIPANTAKNVPVICYCSHVDTSPDSSGAGVKPILHASYGGGEIVLPDDPSVVIKPEEHPDLLEQIGNDLITASGTTLLGADNKAGVAAIMDAAQFLVTHPDIPHGTIKILFTPDEEIGRGVNKVDLEKLGAAFGYTIDGEKRGSLEDETFSADAATITIHGVSAHPGFAQGKMENAIKIAAAVVDRLPKDRLSPESTSGREGFIHPTSISGGLEKAVVQFIVRDFTDEGLIGHEQLLKGILDEVLKDYPNSRAEFKVTEQYRNMKKVLDQHPQVAEFAAEAIRRAGMEPIRSSIRGGTDGSRLSYMGLPCPNIFAGEHAFHSRQEWVSVQDMELAAQTLVHLAMVWEEKGQA